MEHILVEGGKYREFLYDVEGHFEVLHGLVSAMVAPSSILGRAVKDVSTVLVEYRVQSMVDY